MRSYTVVFPLLLAAGCGGTVTVDDDLDTAVAESGLTRADPTTQDPWVVNIGAGTTGCTGSVLSPHWILTAAHCANVAQSSTLSVSSYVPPNGLRHLYTGAARYFPNPEWNPTCPLGQCVDTDADNDIALIELTGGALDISTLGQARLFDDEEEPYHGAGSRAFHEIGFGRGTDVGGSSDCDDGTSRVKRIGYGFTVDVSGDQFQAHAPFGGTHPCPGDSGGPWLFARGPADAKVDMVFAVMSSMRDVPLLHKMWGALVKPRRAWIEETALTAHRPLYCYQHAAGAYQFRRCDESLVNSPD